MSATQQVDGAIQGVQKNARANIERVGSIGEATRLAGESGQALNAIVKLVESSAGQVQAIAASAGQQTSSSEEINRAIDEVNKIAQKSSEAMSDAAQAVGELSLQAKELRQLINEIKGQNARIPASS